MAANQSVVDELVVKLTLDAEQYKKNDQVIINLVNKTEVALKNADEKQTKRDKAAQKRNKDTLKGVKDLALGLRSLTLTIGAMLGVGSAAGLVGAVVALAGMETNLRRASVSTGLSNRELQAWGATARRLGADAQAGASAIADLAREQQQFNLTGNAPTIQAFARMGVRAGPETSIVDILSQAQQIFRQAAPAQRKQIESGLAASGVSPDLIVAIKSEKDVREAFTRSYQESAEENRKALDAVTDALTSLGNVAVSVANSIATVLQPYVEQFAGYVAQGAQQLSAFVDSVVAAGGGVDGFMKVLDEQTPALATLLRNLATGLDVLGQTVDVVVFGFQSLYRGIRELFNWVDQKFGALTGGSSHQLGDALGTVGSAIKWAWGNLVQESRREGAGPIGALTGETGGIRLTPNATRRIAGGEIPGETVAPTPGRLNSGARRIAPEGSLASDETILETRQSTAQLQQPVGRAGVAPTKEELANFFITQGVPLNEAVGLTANAFGESGLKPNAVNPTSGAAGLFQWLSKDRVAAVQAWAQKPITQMSWQEQALAVLNVPSERKRLNQAVAGASTVAEYTKGISDRFEAHGDPDSLRRRLNYAAQFENEQRGSGAPGIGQQINIQSVSVQANTPQEFVGGITRQSGVQNYNSAVR